MLLQVLVALTVSVGVLSGARIVPKVLNVDYQIHSNNDLKELPQVLIKGARRFKFDPHYVKHSDLCGSRKSCLLLNHDRPVTEFSAYNTSTELLNYLQSDEFAKITDGERVTVALCFKDAPDLCEQSAEFEDWLAIVDEFYLKAKAVPNQVEFILDGDAKPVNCLVGRWEKWNSVWISSPSEPFYNNDLENDNYRFQVLNNAENKANWTWLATPDVNYGKFSNGTYPYQLWEPDSMQDIRDYIDIYRGGAEHAPGYHFAINIDIAMFRVYSSRASAGSGSVKVLPGCESTLSLSQPLLEASAAGTDSTQDANPLLVELGTVGRYVAVAVRAQKEVVLSVVQADQVEYQASTLGSVTLPAEASAWLLNDQGNVSLVSAILLSSAGTTNTVLLANSLGRLLSVTFSTAGPIDVTSTVQSSLPPNLSGAVFDLIGADVNACGAYLGTSSNCWYVLSGGEGEVVVSTVLASYDSTSGISTGTVVSSTNIATPSKSTLVDSAKITFLDETPGAAAVVFVSQGLNIFAAEVSLAAGTASVVWSAVSSGKHLQLSVAGTGSDRALMLVTDFGYCYNSHVHNTRAYPMVCASRPVPTETVLDYSLGLAVHWLDALRDANSVVKEVEDGDEKLTYLATSCSEKILHGSYDQGGRPAIALSKHAVISRSGANQAVGVGEEMFFFLEVHEGVPVSVQTAVGSRGGGECGDPVHHDGLVLDAFEVDSWLRSLQRVFL